MLKKRVFIIFFILILFLKIIYGAVGETTITDGYKDYLAEDGTLDIDSFAEAFDAGEIKDAETITYGMKNGAKDQVLDSINNRGYSGDVVDLKPHEIEALAPLCNGEDIHSEEIAFDVVLAMKDRAKEMGDPFIKEIYGAYTDIFTDEEIAPFTAALDDRQKLLLENDALSTPLIRDSITNGEETEDVKKFQNSVAKETLKKVDRPTDGLEHIDSLKINSAGETVYESNDGTSHVIGKDVYSEGEIKINPDGSFIHPNIKTNIGGEPYEGPATINAAKVTKDENGGLVLESGSITLPGKKAIDFEKATIDADGVFHIIKGASLEQTTPDGSTASFSGFDSFTSSLSSTRVTNSAAGSLSNQNFIIKYEDIENLTYENEILTITKAKYLTITQNDKTATLVNAENVTITPYQTTADHADSLTQEATIAANLDHLELTKTLCFESADTLIIGTRGYNALGESCFLYYGPEIRKADATSLENENLNYYS